MTYFSFIFHNLENQKQKLAHSSLENEKTAIP